MGSIQEGVNDFGGQVGSAEEGICVCRFEGGDRVRCGQSGEELESAPPVENHHHEVDQQGDCQREEQLHNTAIAAMKGQRLCT